MSSSPVHALRATPPAPSSGPYDSGDCLLTVCIATFRRAGTLVLLLDDLASQSCPPQQVVVVDNDAAGSARPVVDAFRQRCGSIAVDYAIQPQLNLAITRNRTVDLARGRWLAFIDDDERALPDWIAHLLATQDLFPCDVVLAPVHAVLPPAAPAWLVRSGVYDALSFTTGDTVPASAMRGGNMLIDRRWLRDAGGRFDPAFGQTGGECADLLKRLARSGARIVWSEEAAVLEPVEPPRLDRDWILRRAWRTGLDAERHTQRTDPHGRHWWRRSAVACRSAIAVAWHTGSAGVLWLAGAHHGVRRAVCAAEALGRLTAAAGGATARGETRSRDAHSRPD
ncbi:glycosyltransferase family 2 protein [uncultured Xylophilus sp.]|uniref:glycosyltransferase family 2 protein n=1 Tax=uncultured Xylophilus sp. TaxID=296832 RepID=UPI0025FEE632|nr:glycosyltransferase family 2 protein [uncultured Xylophilus sp.]